jgi:hypothetical protein
MPETLQSPVPTPLTALTEDEILFRDNIRQFADDKIRPLVKEMDEKPRTIRRRRSQILRSNSGR